MSTRVAISLSRSLRAPFERTGTIERAAYSQSFELVLEGIPLRIHRGMA